MRRLQSFWLSARAFSSFLALDLAVRFLSFERIYEFVVRRPVGEPPADEEQARERAEATFRAVLAANRFYYRKQKDCLPKALTTHYLLKRQGIPSELCLGVKTFPFRAHSWVECGDLVLDDQPDRIPEYSVVTRAGARA